MENTATKSFAIKSDNKLRADVNKNFLIRWRLQGKKGSNLVSAGKYAALIDKHCPRTREGAQVTAEKHFDKVLFGGKDRYILKVRETLIIEFISK